MVDSGPDDDLAEIETAFITMDRENRSSTMTSTFIGFKLNRLSSMWLWEI